jgi:hypothetical protein
MNPSVALAAAILVLPFAAAAQGVPPAHSAATESAPASAPAPKPPPDGRTVSGVTVTPAPVSKPCSSRDKACIELVVAELKRRYPVELKRFCFQRDMRAIRSRVLNDELLADLGDSGPGVPTAFGVNAALKTACAPDKK